MNFTQKEINYFIEKATMLSKGYEEQYQELAILGDYLTEDIASDWMFEEAKNLRRKYENGIVPQRIVDLYCEIDKNFSEVSVYGKKYNASIWTLEALKNHPFWEKQRCLAKKLLSELKKFKRKNDA